MQMSNERVRWAPLLALAAVMLPPCYGQDAPPTEKRPAATKGQYRIAGTILSAQDGHPLGHATVRILSTGRAAALQTTIADDSGQFAFVGVPAGTFGLQGSAPGFVTG